MKNFGHDITLVVNNQLPESEIEAWLGACLGHDESKLSLSSPATAPEISMLGVEISDCVVTPAVSNENS